MDSHKLKIILIGIVAAFMALYLGVAAATAQVEALAWVLGVGGLVFVLALGRNVWLLIPAGAALAGGISLLPGNPAPWWVGMLVTATIFLLRFALRRAGEFTWRWNWVDFAIFLHILVLAQAYLRNPTGLTVFGGSDGMVGGRPFFTHAFAIACYVMLSMVAASNLRLIRTAVIVMICCALLDSLAALTGAFVPAVAAIGYRFYSGFSFEAAQGGMAADASEGRIVEGKEVGKTLGQAVFTLFRPLTALNPLNILPFLMLSIAVVTILISGFRSVMGLFAIYFVVGSLVRRKYSDVVIAGGLAVIGLCVLLFVGTSFLPPGAQRILGVLPIPGLVSEKSREHGKESTRWRVEMWTLALTTDRYIFNKTLGDGFGFRKDEMDAAIDAAFGDRRGMARLDPQEVLMRRGSYHGFHVQTIRSTGYVGLAVALFVLGVFFRHAWKHIQYFRGRPEWGYVLYICVPFLIFPFYAMLVFGDYRFDFPQYIIMAGFLKMLWNVRHAEARATAPAAIPAAEPRTQTPVRGLPQPAMRAR